MESVIDQLSNSQKKAHVTKVRSGDTVKVHQKIKEGNKERVQVFQGLVIKTSQKNSHLARITVRRIASGIGVEKSFLIHSPLVVRIEVAKRSKVRRNYLSYMRNLTGKSARLSSLDFDRKAVNAEPEVEEKPKEKEKAPEEAKKETKETEEVNEVEAKEEVEEAKPKNDK